MTKQTKTRFLKEIFLILLIVGLNLFLLQSWFRDGYPALSSSFAPTVIAQARFFKNHGLQSGWQPDWYLGFPTRLAGSPLLPALIAIFPQTSFWLAYRFLTGLGLLLVPLGVYFLVKNLSKRGKGSKTAFLAALGFSFLPSVLWLFPQLMVIGRELGTWPWPVFSLASLGNGTKILGLALLPFCLLTINSFLKRKIKSPFWPALLIGILFLVDLSSIVSLLVLVILLLIAYGLTKRLGNKVKKAAQVLVLPIFLLGFWYTPRFWLQVLGAPSLAGKGAFSVALFLGRILSILVPMVLAVVSARFLKKRRDPLFLFAFLWVFVFGLLTMARFLADHDFWQDYSAWGGELGMGLALWLSLLATRDGQGSLPRKNYKALVLIIVIFLSSLLYIGRQKTLFSFQPNLEGTVEKRVVDWLEEEMKPGERVYLSGSPVFWLNSLIDLAQVRGGTDQGATHPWWDHASYQVRVGRDPGLAWQWLRALGVSGLVVHGPDSAEPYHDFTYPEKFTTDSRFQKVTEAEGDILYRIENSLVRGIKDPAAFLKLEPPVDGTDQVALSQYNHLLNSPIPFEWLSNNQLLLKLENSMPAISLAITFDSGWRASQGGERLEIKKDALGQMVILAENNQPIRLEYHWFSLDQAFGLFLTLVGMGWVLKNKSQKSTSRISEE